MRTALLIVIIAATLLVPVARAQVYEDASRAPAMPVRVVNVERDGFEWADAAVGAAAGVAIATVGFGLALVRSAR